jgi:hypothetical protein
MHDSLTCSKLAVDEGTSSVSLRQSPRLSTVCGCVCNGRHHTALHARREHIPAHSRGQVHRRRVRVSDCATAILQGWSTVACATVAAQFGGAVPSTGVSQECAHLNVRECGVLHSRNTVHNIVRATLSPLAQATGSGVSMNCVS